MVCCNSYFRRFEVDAAGKTGVSLQKHLYFLSFMALLSIIFGGPTTWLGAFGALFLYGFGLNAAKKRHSVHLGYFATCMTAGLVAMFVAVLFLSVFLIAFTSSSHHQHHFSMDHHGNQHHHKDGFMDFSMNDHVKNMMIKNKWMGVESDETADDGTMFKLFHLVAADDEEDQDGQAFPDQVKQDGIVLSDRHHVSNDGVEFEVVDISKDLSADSQQDDDVIVNNNLEIVPLEDPNLPLYNLFDPVTGQAIGVKSSDYDAESKSESESESESEFGGRYGRNHHRHHRVQMTSAGGVVVSMIIVVWAIVLAVKIRTVRLAFAMRRMLIAQNRQRLPTTMRSRPTRPVTIAPPKAPAPSQGSRARQCKRCTYINESSSTRCSMCDEVLPFVSSPQVTIAPPASVPRVYVPGSLYPLNQPLN